MADDTQEAIKAAQATSDKVRLRSAIYNNPSDGMPSEVHYDIPFFLALFDVKINSVSFVFGDNVAADPTDYATLSISKNGVSFLSFTSVTGFTSLGVVEHSVSETLSRGDVLSLTITKNGAGVLLPKFLVSVEYMQT